VFREGVLANLASIGMGGGDITDDIASAFGTRRAQAERLKCFHGSANMSPRDHHEMVDIAPVNPEAEPDGHRITRAQLNTVIRARLERLMAEVQKELKRLDFADPVGRQLVLTGGGAELRGIADYAQQALGSAVRVGRPRGLTALPDAHSGPAFATLAGLAAFAASDPVDLRSIEPARSQTVVRPTGMAVFGRLLAAFKANY